MLLSLLAWLEGASISAAACVLLGRFHPNGDPAGLAAFVAALGVGLLGPRDRRATDSWDEVIRLPLVSARDALIFVASTAAAVALGAAIDPGALGATGRILAVVPAAFAGGRMLWRVILYTGVRRTRRLHLFGLAVVGLVMGPLHRMLGATPSMVVLGALLALLLAVVHLKQVREEWSPRPEAVSWTSGPITSLAMLAFGAGAGVVLTRAVDSLSEQPDASLAQALAWGSAIGAVGAIWVILAAPRVRRVGVHAGAAALIAAGAVMFARHDGSVIDRVASIVGSAAALGVFFIGIPLFIVTYAVVPAPRFYAMMPPGGKIIDHLPEDQRPLPGGAPLRSGLLAIGIASGVAGSSGVHVGANGLGPLLLAASGAALILFDPRAGHGRTAMTFSVAAAIAALLTWI